MIILRKSLISVITASMVLMMVGCSSQNNPANANPGEAAKETVDYPTKTITGVIPWGAGGATDTISRAIAPIAEKQLGQSIILTNKAGATGAIGMEYVADKKSDGYNLLFTAENAAIYGVLGVSKLGFQDFYPINIMARVIPTIVVSADSKYQTMNDLVKDALANPGKVKMGSTGPAGQPFVVTTMLGSVTNTEYNMVPFDGEGPALTALLGGHIDVTVAGFTAAYENAKAGKVRILSVINEERIEQLKDVPAIAEAVPEMAKFLPWGPFYGVWVKNDTPDDIKKALVDAFAKAQQDPQFQNFLKQSGAVSVGLSGDEAIKYWQEWQSTTAWLLHDTGEAKVSPAELNIPKKE
ncbi:tripartite tricarboxylate transporter substrate binding protein [Ammoniphilus sp. 3BR4]|uniref:tripartite tricarboxylate transporter substrate binding protein n=1 Tax=Ammoniphilus sp. 3BR4 TaxID=3158265 RepID=UPI0034668AEF